MKLTLHGDWEKRSIGNLMGRSLKRCLHFGIGSMISTFLDTGLKMAITYLAIAGCPIMQQFLAQLL